MAQNSVVAPELVGKLHYTEQNISFNVVAMEVLKSCFTSNELFKVNNMPYVDLKTHVCSASMLVEQNFKGQNNG